MFENYIYEKLRPHIGHNISCVAYGKDKEDPVDICIECEDCNEVLISTETFNEEDYMAQYKYKYKVEKIESIEIKCCPFCGSEDVTPIHHNGSWGYTPSEDYVKCNNCEATGGMIKDTNCGNHFKEAIDKWNHRV